MSESLAIKVICSRTPYVTKFNHFKRLKKKITHQVCQDRSMSIQICEFVYADNRCHVKCNNME